MKNATIIQSQADAAGLSRKDRQLLDLLQTDCRLPNAELAQKVGMSASACWRRIRALEEGGLIRGQVALLDPKRAGFTFSALVLVSLSRHDRAHVDAFVQRTRLRPEILECHAVTGDADYVLRVVCRDADAYNQFLDDFLFELPGISRVRTSVVLREIKQTTRLPL